MQKSVQCVLIDGSRMPPGLCRARPSSVDAKAPSIGSIEMPSEGRRDRVMLEYA